ncbi:MAG TPA: type II 3-dehydroquinate dehydratase [Acidimicrobiales bacterium]|jgi:3-dehydroquinate dehydratase-2|nr:type II 3-dehydroquinate dehydratase [Acidimicrobiales bacterium]
MSRQILVVSGPNLDLLGTRSPEIYGTSTLDDHLQRFREAAVGAGYSVSDMQSNFEGDLIEAIHAARSGTDAIVINLGALTHTSWALCDALAIFEGVKIEVHLSNPAAREPFRHVSAIAGVVNGSIAGFGGLSYDLALVAVRRLLEG